jgi:hypothetical protein
MAIVLGGLAAILLVANAWFVGTTESRLDRQLTAIREAGEPLTLADLARPPIPPEKNAATYLNRAMADVKAIEQELRAGYYEWCSNHENSLMPPDIQKSVKAVLDARPNVIPLLEQAAACPDYDAQFDFTLPALDFLERWPIDCVQDNRNATRVLQARADLFSSQGNSDAAVHTALATFRLARHFEHNPLLIGYLLVHASRLTAVNSTVVALQSGPVSQKVRDALDAELAAQERSEGFSRAILSERAFGRDLYDTMPLRNFWVYARGHWNLDESEYLEILDTYLALMRARGSYEQLERALNGPEPKRDRRGLAQLLLPVFMAHHCTHYADMARIRCLRVLNAVQAHAPAGSMKVPELATLGLPSETTTDPFNEAPLHVKRTPEGWLVYSVGQNLRDDGGKLDASANDDGDVGVGPLEPTSKPTKP